MFSGNILNSKSKILLIFIATLMLLLSCSRSKSYYNNKFIEKYGNENFDEYKDFSIFIRGANKDGDPVVYLVDMCHKNSLFIVVLNSNTGEVKSSRYHLTQDSSVIKRNMSISLVEKFWNYRIYALYVDSVYNVKINVIENAEPNLIRFSDKKYIKDEYLNGWRKIKDNWYEKKTNYGLFQEDKCQIK